MHEFCPSPAARPAPSPLFGQAAARRLLPAALLALLGLAACTNDPEQQAPQCPKVSLVPDGASLTRYRGTGRDLTDLVLSAKLVDVNGFCRGQRGKPTLLTQARLTMLLRRGPAADGREADIPFGVGVVKDGQILDVAERSEHVVFPPNTDTVQLTADPVSFTIPTKGEEIGPQFHIYFWLKLTPDELAANRKPG